MGTPPPPPPPPPPPQKNVKDEASKIYFPIFNNCLSAFVHNIMLCDNNSYVMLICGPGLHRLGATGEGGGGWKEGREEGGGANRRMVEGG